MARSMLAGDSAVFRAVITHAEAAEPGVAGSWITSVEYCGPFRASAPATAAIKTVVRGAANFNEHQLRYARFPGRVRSASGHVERAELKWEAV